MNLLLLTKYLMQSNGVKILFEEHKRVDKNERDIIISRIDFFKTISNWNEKNSTKNIDISKFLLKSFKSLRIILKESSKKIDIDDVINISEFISHFPASDRIKKSHFEKLVFAFIDAHVLKVGYSEELKRYLENDIKHIINLNLWPEGLKLIMKDKVAFFNHENEFNKQNIDTPCLVITKELCRIMCGLEARYLKFLNIFLRFHKIDKLTLLDCEMGDKLVKTLSKLNFIRGLTYKIDIMPDLPQSIQKLDFLKGLKIEFNFTEVESLDFKKLINLEVVEISSNQVLSREPKIYIDDLSKLQKLVLRNIGMGFNSPIKSNSITNKNLSIDILFDNFNFMKNLKTNRRF